MKPVVHRKPKSQLRELVETLGSAIIIAAFIMIFIARAYTVNGDTMLPTLTWPEEGVIVSTKGCEPAAACIPAR